MVKRQVEARVAAASGGNAFLGDLLAFFGAVTMAAYEMAFNIVGTLPNEEAQRTRYAKDSHSRNSRIVDSSTDEEPRRPHRADSEGGESQGLLEQQTGDEDADEHGVDGEIARKSMEVQHHNETAESTERTGLWNPKDSHEAGVTDSYQTISPAPEIEEEEDGVGLTGQEEGKKPAAGTVRILDVDGRLDRLNREMDDSTQDQPLAWIPPPLPFGMHPIIITSGIGFVTMCTLWIGLPIANLLGWEVFELPPDGKTWFFIIVVILTGIVFNGCFSILLAIWGPVLASVSCLLTTVLVFVADIMLGHDFQWVQSVPQNQWLS